MDLIGFRELDHKLAELGRAATGRELRAGVKAAAEVVVERAKQLIPVGVDSHRTYKGRMVRPGFARRSVRSLTKVDKSGQQATAAIGVRKEAFYAVQFVEVGTRFQSAQPWLRPAMQATQSEQVSALSNRVRKGIEKAARRR